MYAEKRTTGDRSPVNSSLTVVKRLELWSAYFQFQLQSEPDLFTLLTLRNLQLYLILLILLQFSFELAAEQVSDIDLHKNSFYEYL